MTTSAQTGRALGSKILPAILIATSLACMGGLFGAGPAAAQAGGGNGGGNGGGGGAGAGGGDGPQADIYAVFRKDYDQRQREQYTGSISTECGGDVIAARVRHCMARR